MVPPAVGIVPLSPVFHGIVALFPAPLSMGVTGQFECLLIYNRFVVIVHVVLGFFPVVAQTPVFAVVPGFLHEHVAGVGDVGDDAADHGGGPSARFTASGAGTGGNLPFVESFCDGWRSLPGKDPGKDLAHNGGLLRNNLEGAVM